MEITWTDIEQQLESIGQWLNSLPNTEDKINALNNIRSKIHEFSPMKNEPVDCVLWIKSEDVVQNEYNPNSVAIPEMELLKESILVDGYTQPVVVMKNSTNHEVVDGFHRTKIGKEVGIINKRILGRIPVAIINQTRTEKNDRMASTIRHNRARGKHSVDLMAAIVLDLSKNNWGDSRICKELGMEQDEVLRLKQITGLAELFSDKEFSKAWEMVD